MINKTFNSDSTDGRALEVGRNGERPWLNIREFDLENTMFMLATSDAPALALAILEAAGWPNEHLATTEILRRLRELDEHAKAVEAEAREREELEAEALELMNVRLRASGAAVHLTKATADPVALGMWLAVARRAREMRAEK